MITAAHVGIGIRGVEGFLFLLNNLFLRQQAARASDYAIGEFKLLRRLLLYYGRESYRKNSYLIVYNFYKNMVIVLPALWFGFFNGMSGQILYDAWIFQLYNLSYTSLPIIAYALMDEDFPSSEFYDIKN